MADLVEEQSIIWSELDPSRKSIHTDDILPDFFRCDFGVPPFRSPGSVDRAVLGELRNPLITSSNDVWACSTFPRQAPGFHVSPPPPPVHHLSSGATCFSTCISYSTPSAPSISSAPPPSASAPPCCLHSTPLPTHRSRNPYLSKLQVSGLLGPLGPD